MSIRSHAQRINTFNASAAPSNPIDFRDDFVNSTAVYAANTDETVSQIMQRLDQLQSKIGANEAAAATPAAPRAAATSSSAAARTPSTDLHARVATLESVHEDTLRSLGVKLDGVERKLNEQREVESLMGQISSKFSRIETQLGAAKESEGLMNKVASKFAAVESRLQSAMQMGDRVAQLESRLGSHAELHSRVNRLEASMAPDPEQERLITRISAKLDSLERARGGEGEAHNLGAQSYRPTARSGEREDAQFLGASADDREGRISYLQSRIEKLKELRSRYELEEEAA